MRTQRKFLAWIMVLILSVSMIPTAVLAGEPEDEIGEEPVICAGYEADENCQAETHMEGCPLYAEPKNDEDAYPINVSKEVHENESNLCNDYNADNSTIARANSYPVEALENNDVIIVADYSWFSEDADEYHLNDVDDLLGLSDITHGEASNITETNFNGKKVILAADIDLSQMIDSWKPISSNSNPFCGEFDGGSHTISNLKIEEADDWSGLFSAVGDGGYIHDITIENPKIVGATGKSCIGALSGGTTGSNGTATIKNCKVNSSDDAEYFISGTMSHIGGLLGAVTCGTVENCYSNIKVVGGNTAGGLAGLVRNATISNCQAQGEIDGLTNQSSYIGGLIGSVEAKDGYSVIIKSNIATGNFSQVDSSGNKGDIKANGALIGGIGVTNSGTVTIEGNYACGKKTRNNKNTCENLAGTFPDSGVAFHKNLVTNGGVVDTEKTGFLAVSKNGYIVSWCTDTNFSAQTSDSEPQNNVTYYAKWIELKSDDISMEYGSSQAVPAIEGVTLSSWQSSNSSIVSIENGQLKANKVGTTMITATATIEAGGTGTLTVNVEVTPLPITFGSAPGENPGGSITYARSSIAPEFSQFATFYPARVENGNVSVVAGSSPIALTQGTDITFVYDAGGGKAAYNYLPLYVTDDEGVEVTVRLINGNYCFVTRSIPTPSDTITEMVVVTAADKTKTEITGLPNVDANSSYEYTGVGIAPITDLTEIHAEGIDSFTVHFHRWGDTVFPPRHLENKSASELTQTAIQEIAPKEPGSYLMILDGVSESQYGHHSWIFTIEKGTPKGEPTFEKVSSGVTLSTVTLSGSMKNAAGAEVEGTFTWDNGDNQTVERGKSYAWTFTPNDTNHYNTASGESVVWPATSGGGSGSGGGSSSGGSGSSAVSVDSAKHGSVTVSPKSAKKGDTVTVTVKPDKGYELDDLTVTDKNGNEVKVTRKSDTRYTFTMPAGKVTVEATFVKVEETLEHSFTDVPNGYWAGDAIAWASENGCMNGTTTETFNPEGTVSRQQLWMILARLSGYNPAAMAEAKSWAVDNGISDGTAPGGPVSRQQLVTILYRYAVRMGYQTDRTADLTAYPDHASVAAYAADAMSWSVANSIVGGTTQGTLNPAGTATRAQFAVILQRFVENMMG